MASGIILILQIIWVNMKIAMLKARLALPAGQRTRERLHKRVQDLQMTSGRF